MALHIKFFFWMIESIQTCNSFCADWCSSGRSALQANSSHYNHLRGRLIQIFYFFQKWEFHSWQVDECLDPHEKVNMWTFYAWISLPFRRRSPELNLGVMGCMESISMHQVFVVLIQELVWGTQYRVILNRTMLLFILGGGDNRVPFFLWLFSELCTRE